MEQLSISETQIKASCHCGAITLTAPNKPKEINQCTICRRYSAAWAYYKPKDVEIKIKEGSSAKKYIWGDRTASFDFCDTCGCVCYWYPLASDGPELSEGDNQMGVNTRMMDPAELRGVNRLITNDYIRTPIKNKEAAHAEDQARYCWRGFDKESTI